MYWGVGRTTQASDWASHRTAWDGFRCGIGKCGLVQKDLEQYGGWWAPYHYTVLCTILRRTLRALRSHGQPNMITSDLSDATLPLIAFIGPCQCGQQPLCPQDGSLSKYFARAEEGGYLCTHPTVQLWLWMLGQSAGHC